MFFLQVINTVAKEGEINVVTGSLVMVLSVFFLIMFVLYYQRRLLKANNNTKRLQEERQANMLRASIKFQEDERNRIAADLHDNAGPLLATVRLYLNEGFVNKDKPAQLQAIYNARQIIDDTIEFLRNISHGLMPPTLKNFGLGSAVTNLFEKINGSGRMAATSRFNSYEEKLEPEKEMLCFRVIQELVSNIIKHSNASFIHLIQNRTGDVINLMIQHDGKGITQPLFDKLVVEAYGLGLKNIENRMKVIGGTISFYKDVVDGIYKVTMSVPMRKVHS